MEEKICKYCGKSVKDIANHIRWQHIEPNRPTKRQKSQKWYDAMHTKKGKYQNHIKAFCKCPFCGLEKEMTKEVFTRHKKYCKMNPNREVCIGHKHTEETKKHLSEQRKKYLSEHPDNHPWKNNKKFKSKPCEQFKQFLKEKGYNFLEECEVVPGKHYSVDICFPDLMLIFEINGNQHYNMKTMELMPYYQERHNEIQSLGWTIIEVPYNQSYNEDFRLGVCRQLDAKLTSNQSYKWEFESPHPYLKTLQELNEERSFKKSLKKLRTPEEQYEFLKKKEEKKRLRDEAYQRHLELLKNAKIKAEKHEKMLDNYKKRGLVPTDVNGKIIYKVSEDEWNRRKELILNCGVDLTKFGWVSKVIEKTGLSKKIVEGTVGKFMLNVFKRKS